MGELCRGKGKPGSYVLRQESRAGIACLKVQTGKSFGSPSPAIQRRTPEAYMWSEYLPPMP